MLANLPPSPIKSSKVPGRCDLGERSSDATLSYISARSSVRGPCEMILLPAALVASADNVTVGEACNSYARFLFSVSTGNYSYTFSYY